MTNLFKKIFKILQRKTFAVGAVVNMFLAALTVFVLNFVPGSFFLANALYSQTALNTNADSAGDKNPSKENQSTSQNDERKTEGEPAVEKSADSGAKTATETKAGEKEEAAPVVYTNPVMQGRLNDQYRWTPEDPSFLYETRNIPDHKNKQEFLPSELEKVEVREQIKDEVNFRKSLDKIKIRLPDMTQTLILVSIIIVILIYRSRVRKQHGPR